MWGTPKASDAIMGMTARTSGRPIEKSTHLQTQVHVAELSSYATPQARDYRTGQSSRWEDTEYSRNLNDQIGGQLHPDWEEWLMGVPVGWTALDVTVEHPAPPGDFAWWPEEPEGVPRVAKGIPNRVERLKALGNMVVPQQFYPFYRAIAEIERRA